jgi:hypothetical protein
MLDAGFWIEERIVLSYLSGFASLPRLLPFRDGQTMGYYVNQLVGLTVFRYGGIRVGEAELD